MKKLLPIVLLALLVLGLCGCTDRDQGAWDEAEEVPTLIRVEYETTSGSIYGVDFSVSVTPAAVETATYFDEALGDYVTLEQQPIPADRWTDIVRAVQALDSVLEMRPEQGYVETDSPADSLVLDGGGSETLFLTWRTTAGWEARRSYRIPNDRRFVTLTDLLRETVHPTGREILWYEAPTLQGIYFRRGDPLSGMASDYSYQCIYLPDETGTYGGDWYFVAYDGELSGSVHVTQDIWEKLSKACKSLGLLELERGSSDKKSYATLYLTDGTQYSVNPSRKTMAALRELFSQAAKGLLAG